MTGQCLTILTVDDEEIIRETIASYLENRGFRVLQATNGREGLEVFAAERPDLLLVDLRMPEMDGLEVLSRLQVDAPETPTIVVSGTGVLRDAIEAIKRGAWDYVTKPIEDMEVLGLAVDKALERASLRRKVRQAEERYFNLVQNIPMLIFSLDDKLQLEFINQGCQPLLGFSREEALANPNWLLDRVHPDQREWVLLMLQECLKDCSLVFSRNCMLLHKDGHIVHGILKSIPFSDCAAHEGRPRLEGLIVDLTDRLLLEKILVQKEKLNTLGAISAEVAHEIRNPLMVIGGFAKRLATKMPDLKEAGIILEESERLERILERIRSYLSPVRLHPVHIKLADVVRDSLALLTPELAANGIVPRLELEGAETLVEEDPDILAQVVINLIRSTHRALPPRGTMWLTSSTDAGFVHLEVGGDQTHAVENLEKVFLPFDDGGDSIGLPVCYRLMRTMGGALRFEQKEGRGWFIMSVLTAQARSAHPESPA
jgi:PAS domain S-box-containing protein